MFKEARIKLTAWYLIIIMAISLSFSLVIYLGVNRELSRLENLQTSRQQRVDRLSMFLKDSGLPLPQEPLPQFDSEGLEQARIRIISILGIINLSILVFAGAGGYFLAGQTLDPIAKMVNDQKDFVSNASHELRTPLTSLKTEIEVTLRDKKVSLSKISSLLKSNLEDVNRMQKLSNYLLELNRFQSDKENIKFDNVNLASVAIKAIGKKIVKKSLTKTIVNGNEASLVELVTILIDNAFKYSGRVPKIEVRVGKKMLEIKDNGQGISKTDLPHIFDRFYRGDKSRQQDGYGLGLSIAKQIVEMHNAKILVNSTIGKGTSFKVIFS